MSPPLQTILRIEIGADPPSRLDKALARDVPDTAALSRSRLARMIAAGAVHRSGQPLTDPKAKVCMGDIIEVTLELPADIDAQPEAIPLSIAYEDSHLIVVDKPAGLVVHPAPGSPSGTLVNALLHHCSNSLSGIGGAKRPGIVHRIDKDTSGLLVVAKTDAAHHGLAAQFEAHTATRRYVAICHGAPDPADPRLRNVPGVSWEADTLKIETLLARHRTDRQRQAVTPLHGRHAVTRVRVLERFGTPSGAALLSCTLETGRTHQIRVHLTYAGHALVGDPVYGARRTASVKCLGPKAAAALNAAPRQALHAAHLGFTHPITGTALSFDSPLPADLASLLDILRG